MDALAPPQVVGRYVIYNKIASGGMASVHFGRLLGAVGFARTVAIKRLHPHLAEDPEFVSTMIDEARLAARIHHPNVVATLDVVGSDGELLVVMEYVRGESLSRLLKAESARGRRTPLPIASAIVIGALHGLHAAHEATSERGTPLGIVHRDVSPQNILVGVDGVARVIDFGVAKAAGRLQTTREGVVKGKMAYMAPELLEAGEATRQVDIYAMAVVLWEALAGKRLFQADSDGQVAVKVLAGATEPPSRYAPSLPAGLDALVMKGLAKDPAERFASAREMAETLMRVVPPAFATEVGEWVEDVGREPLAQRGVLLAEIESGSGIVPKPSDAADLARERAAERASRPDEPQRAPQGEDAVHTVVSQPSSLSVETPSFGATLRPHRTKLVGAVLVALTLGGGFVAFRQGAFTKRAHEQTPSVAAPAISAPETSEAPPSAAQTVTSVPAPVPSVSPALRSSASTTTTSPRPVPTVKSTHAPSAHGPPASSGSIRFTRPD